MASKNLMPTASSDDDEEVKSSSEAEEEQRSDNSPSEEDENEPTNNNKTQTLVVDATTKTKRAMKEVCGGSGDDDEEVKTLSEAEEDQRSDDSPSEEDEDEPTNNKKTQTLAVDATAKTKRAMKEVCGSSGEAQTSTKKRQREETLTDNDMNAKVSKKKASMQRLEWSGDDVILVLQGMINFKAEKGIAPSDDKNGFYEFVKGSLSIDVSSYQFTEKMRSLKKTFINKVKTGKGPSSSKPHDQKAFDLSKSIWGNDVESAVRRSERIINLEEEKKMMINHEGGDWFERSFIVGQIASFGVEEEVVKRRWSLVPQETKKAMKRKWDALQRKELEFVVRKKEVVHEVVSMMIEASIP